MSSYNSSRATEKKQWRSLFLIGGGLLAMVMLVLMMTSKATVNPDIARKVKIKTPLKTMSPEETWRAKSEEVLARMKKSIRALEQKRKADAQKIGELRKELKNAQKRKSLPATRPTAKKQRFSVLKPPVQFNYKTSGTKPAPGQSPVFRARAVGNRNGMQAVNFQPLEIVEDTIDLPVAKVVKKQLSGKTVKNYMPAGTFMEGILLSGLDAPSGVQTSGNPVPALIQITDYGMLPNDWRKDIKKCRVTVEGYGDLASERAYLRTLFLSCVKHNGAVIEVPLKAYVSGEDGKTGLRGKVVSKQGRMIAKSIWAGTVAGLGGALTNRYTTTLTSPLGSVSTYDGKNSFKRGFSSGIGKALDRVANYYLKQAERVYPVIEIGAGRRVTIILQKGVRLEKNKPPVAATARRVRRPVPQQRPAPRAQRVYRAQYSHGNRNRYNTNTTPRRQ